mgnify:FL=1
MNLLNAGPSERGWHRIESALRCPRLYAWEHSGQMERVLSEPLVRGSLIHIGLAHYYQRLKETQTGGNPDDWYPCEEAIQILAQQESAASPLWEKLVPLAIDVCTAYKNNWLRESWKILEVEFELRARIGEKKYLYTQRADLIVEDLDGKVWIVDHKTAYRIVAKTLRQYTLDGQFLGYQMFGHAKYKEAFGGVILNRIKASPKYDFDRRSLEPSPAALRDFVPALLEAERRVESLEGKPPREWPMTVSNQVCYGKYGQCDAYNLCRFGGE